MTEAEVYILVVAIVFMGLGMAGGIAKLASNTHLRIFKYLLVTGVIGIILIPLSLLISAINGRTSSFLEALSTDFTGVIGSIGSEENYSSVCKNGICMHYCCNDIVDSSLLWKDCDKQCSSVKGSTGVMTGDDCIFVPRQSYCKDTGTGGTIRITDSTCNNLEDLGPITCTCCSNSASVKWWDCSAQCSSYPIGSGFSLNPASCQGVTTKYCRDDSRVIDNSQINNQSY